MANNDKQTKALEWLRSKLTVFDTNTYTIDETQAATYLLAPGTYRATYSKFKGTLPIHMARAVSGAQLRKGELENETLHLGTGYRGGKGKCEFFYTVYEKID